MKRYIVGLGEALWDVLPEGKKLGGAPANFAYHAGQFLGSDNTIAISALGEDSLADETIDALKEHNLNYLMPRVPYPTGTVQVTLTGEGIPTYEIKEKLRRMWRGITSPLRQKWKRLPKTPVPYASAHWLSVISSAVIISVSSLTLHLMTVCAFVTSTCVSSSIVRKCLRIRSASVTS